MNYQLSIYLGSACITEQSKEPYPIGERHAFLFYLKIGENDEQDLIRAEEIITNLGFDQIEFLKHGKLDPNKTLSEDKKEQYDNAIEFGYTFVFYEDPM